MHLVGSASTAPAHRVRAAAACPAPYPGPRPSLAAAWRTTPARTFSGWVGSMGCNRPSICKQPGFPNSRNPGSPLELPGVRCAALRLGLEGLQSPLQRLACNNTTSPDQIEAEAVLFCAVASGHYTTRSCHFRTSCTIFKKKQMEPTLMRCLMPGGAGARGRMLCSRLTHELGACCC